MSALRKLFIVCLIFFAFFLLSHKQSQAISLTISGGNSRIKSTDEYIVHIHFTIKVADGTRYYLRGAFAKQGSKKYCGYIWNGNSWYNGPKTGDGWKNYLPIIIKNDTWLGELKTKIDTDNKDCKDPGTYIFKIERFKSSDKGTFDTSSEQTVYIDFPPTSAPTSYQSQSLSQTAIIQVSADTSNTSVTTANPTSQTEITSTPSFLPSILPSQTSITASEASVLGTASASILPSLSPTIIKKNKTTKVQGISSQTFPIFLALGGVILFIAVSIGAYQVKRIKGTEIT